MTKRHIAFLISDLSAGGAQRVASILCTHWIARGWRVSILTFETPQIAPFYNFHPDIDLIRLNLTGGSGNLLKSIPANIKRICTLRKTLKDLSPDLLITFMPESNTLGILSTRLTGIPVLVSERSDPVFIPSQKAWRILRRLTYPFAKTVICQTPKAASFFTWHKHAVDLPNPILKPEITEDKNSSDLPEKFIVAIGRLGKEKGMDVLVKAFAQISTEYPAHHLVLIGEGDQRTFLEELIIKRRVTDHVHLIGEKENPFNLAERADIFVMPSHFEGFPNALCEAMSAGLPAIASYGAAGALPFIKDKKNILLFETGSSDDLADKMKLLLSDAEKSLAISRAAEKTAKTLSPDLICAKWDALIEDVLKN